MDFREHGVPESRAGIGWTLPNTTWFEYAAWNLYINLKECHVIAFLLGPFACMCMCVCACMCVRVCVGACMCVCVRACMRMDVSVSRFLLFTQT